MDKETFEGGGCIHYLDYGDGFTDVDKCQSSSHYPFNVFHLLCVYYTSIKLEEKQNGLSADLKQSPYNQGRTTHFHELCGTDLVYSRTAVFSAFWARSETTFSSLSGRKARPGLEFWPADCARPPPTHHLNGGDSERKWVPELRSTASCHQYPRRRE